MYPIASGLTSHSGITIDEIWSLKTLVKFYTATIFSGISNTEYEGEIKAHSDTVHIINIPDIDINNYVINGQLTRQRLSFSSVDLLIDKGKTWSIAVNDVEKMQSKISYVEKCTDDAGRRMSIAIDYDVLSNVYADASAYNSGATAGYKTSGWDLGASGAPIGLDKTNILDQIVDCGAVLAEYDVPPDGNFMALPVVFHNMLQKSDIKDASMMGDGQSVLRNGRVGKIYPFEIYVSNQLATTADSTGVTAHNCIFGHRAAITFASQIVEKRTIPNPDDFGFIIEGLQVYGYKVIKPQALGHLYAYKA